MLIRTPPLLDHLDQIIFQAAAQGGAVQSVTLPVWCQQVFINEVMATLPVLTDKKQFGDLDSWGTCEYRGVQILFHDKLFAELRMKPH